VTWCKEAKGREAEWLAEREAGWMKRYTDILTFQKGLEALAVLKKEQTGSPDY